MKIFASEVSMQISKFIIVFFFVFFLDDGHTDITMLKKNPIFFYCVPSFKRPSAQVSLLQFVISFKYKYIYKFMSEISNMRLNTKFFTPILVVSSKMNNSLFGEKS